MINKDNISDELLAAFLEGNVNKEEVKQVINAVGTDAELKETLDIALQIEEEEQPILQMAAEGGRNLCEIQCEAYVLRQRGKQVDEEELLKVAKTFSPTSLISSSLRESSVMASLMGVPLMTATAFAASCSMTICTISVVLYCSPTALPDIRKQRRQKNLQKRRSQSERARLSWPLTGRATARMRKQN